MYNGLQGAVGQLGDKQCVPPAVAQPGIGSCDQFGSYCRMWVSAEGLQLSRLLHPCWLGAALDNCLTVNKPVLRKHW